MQLAGISKRISFHAARHTNATLLIYKGVNITTVQKLLGHKSVRTTQVYTDIMDMTVIQDLENINCPNLLHYPNTDFYHTLLTSQYWCHMLISRIYIIAGKEKVSFKDFLFSSEIFIIY